MKRTQWATVALCSMLIAALACFGLAGCSSSNGSASGSGSTSASASTSQARPDKITVTDMADRTVEIKGDVKPVATFGSVGVINAFVECMGKGSLICNEMPANFTKSDQWAMQYKFAPQIKDAPLLETADGVDIEKTLTLNPDLCITMTKETADQLAEKGLPCIVIQWNDTEDVKEAVTLMGQVLNAEDRAAEYNAYFDAMVAKATGITSKLADDKKVPVLYGDVTTLKNPHIISEWWINVAGGKSVTAADHKKNSMEFSKEDLLAWAPEVIFASTSKVAEIYADDTLANIPAVANKKIYVVPTVAHVWGNRTVEQPLTVMWAMNKLYPDLYSEADLSKDIKEFYNKFFEYNMSDDEVKSIIHYKE